MADFDASRNWNDASTVDMAVGFGFDYVFFGDATTAEMRSKSERFVKIVKDVKE